MLTKTVRIEKTTENGERYSFEEVLELDENYRTINPLRNEEFGAVHECGFDDIMAAYRDYKTCNEW